MKKLLCAAIALLCAAAMQAQEEEKDVTKFLGIPVDGDKPAMIKKLKAKGFTPVLAGEDILEGEFNGTDVVVYIGTNKNKVWRIALLDKYPRDEREIKQRFNRLCEQFENNPKYDASFMKFMGKTTIPNDEDLGYEIAVNNKRYEAIYYQLPLQLYKQVCFFISRDNDGEYRICMYYDNEYNKANGEDL